MGTPGRLDRDRRKTETALLRRGYGRGGLLFPLQLIDTSDEEKDNKGKDEKIDDRINEWTIGK